MELYHDIDLQDCPLCHGPGLIEEEEGWCLYVACLDCGCRTAELPFSSPEERLAAAKQVLAEDQQIYGADYSSLQQDAKAALEAEGAATTEENIKVKMGVLVKTTASEEQKKAFSQLKPFSSFPICVTRAAEAVVCTAGITAGTIVMLIEASSSAETRIFVVFFIIITPIRQNYRLITGSPR